MEKIAILGFGCAGYHCAKTLRDEGFSGAIHVYSDTDLPPSNPMLTTYYAGRRLPWDGLFPFGSLEHIVRCGTAADAGPRKRLRLHVLFLTIGNRRV